MLLKKRSGLPTKYLSYILFFGLGVATTFLINSLTKVTEWKIIKYSLNHFSFMIFSWSLPSFYHFFALITKENVLAQTLTRNWFAINSKYIFCMLQCLFEIILHKSGFYVTSNLNKRCMKQKQKTYRFHEWHYYFHLGSRHQSIIRSFFHCITQNFTGFRGTYPFPGATIPYITFPILIWDGRHIHLLKFSKIFYEITEGLKPFYVLFDFHFSTL